MINDLKEKLRAQGSSIIITALMAAGITFIQSIAVSTGACPPVNEMVKDAGILGGVIKTAHSGFLLISQNIKV
jgi:hypothetical protein